jgi:hypothetical protein
MSKIPLVSLGRKGRLSEIASNPLVIKLVTRYLVFPELGVVVEAGFDFGFDFGFVFGVVFGVVFTIWTTSEAGCRAELGSISLGLTNRMRIRICICCFRLYSKINFKT